MEQEILEQLAAGIGIILLGISGWLLPYKYNILRLKRILAKSMSEEKNKLVPKVVGTLLIVSGSAIIFGSLTIGRFS